MQELLCLAHVRASFVTLQRLEKALEGSCGSMVLQTILFILSEVLDEAF
jgi:hypothetical protein